MAWRSCRRVGNQADVEAIKCPACSRPNVYLCGVVDIVLGGYSSVGWEHGAMDGEARRRKQKPSRPSMTGRNTSRGVFASKVSQARSQISQNFKPTRLYFKKIL